MNWRDQNGRTKVDRPNEARGAGVPPTVDDATATPSELDLRRLSMADRVYDVLRDWLVSGRLSPTQRISERDIAAELKISRTPLRSALARLEHDRLVGRSRSGALQVVVLAEKQLADLYACRSALEALAARLAAQSATANQVDRLREEVDIAARAYVRGDAERAAEANRGFHALLYQASGNSSLSDALRAQAPHFDRIRLLLVRTDVRGPAFVAEHQAIVDAIKAADPAKAELAVRDHLASIVSRAFTTPGAIVTQPLQDDE